MNNEWGLAINKQGGLGKASHVSRLTVYLFFCFLMACARQMPPPGGPPDKTPPRVIDTVPADDSVRVGLDTPIRIRFSEGMDRRSVERALFISPQGSEEPDFRWRGDVLEIRLPDGLQAERTYLVTVGQESADEWRNRMRSSYSFGFATGDRLNRGELNGRVLKSKEERGQVFVWAYDLSGVTAPDPGRDRPTYVTQPDETGHFVLPRLGSGNYRIFAFGDQNNDRTYSSGDLLALPPGDVAFAGEERVRLGDLKLAVRDTSAPALVAARTPDQQHILMRFDEPVRVWGVEITDLSVLETYQDPVDSSGVGLITGLQTQGVEYRVRVDIVDRWGNRDTTDATVRGDGTRDRRAPEVLVRAPAENAENVLPTAVIRMLFSDAMRLDPVSDFWIASDSTVVPQGHFEWVAPNHLAFTPDGLWASGETIRLSGNRERLLDIGGNVLSEPISFVFSVMDTAALGHISGTTSSSDVVIWVEGLAHDFFREQVLQDTTFSLTNLLPETYRISGFLDRDRNGQWMSGQIHPFLPADPLVARADTVEVRARWETEVGKLESKIWWMLPASEESP
ncbi:MAG: Ig-like domain-containing protein [Candidatus Latescibacteria bacterium]|nr:Ig-like domain-containing protein [Candidatus Latescibacterota bacterium]